MAYEGETVRIYAVATDFNDVAVNSSEVTGATLDLYDQAGNYEFTARTLTWNPTGTVEVAGATTTGYWYYDWQNSVAGSWLAKATFVGVQFTVFNYGTIRIKPLKVVPTGIPH